MEEGKSKFDQVKYVNDFKKEHYDRIEILAAKGKKEEVKSLAKEAGQSMSEYILQAIKERAEREN